MPSTYDDLIALGVPKNLLDSAIAQCVDLNLASIYKYLQLPLSRYTPRLTIQSDWQLLILGGYTFDESLLTDSFLSQKDNWGAIPIHYAAWSGNPIAIEAMFVKAGALGIKHIDLFNQKDSNGGETMAHYAAWSGSPIAIEAMFAKAEALGINPLDLFNQKDNYGCTMANFAAGSGNPKAAFVAFINFYAKKLETDITITEIKWPDGVNEEDYPEIQAIQKRLDENKAIQAANTTLAGLAVTAGSIPEFNNKSGGSTTAKLCRDVWRHITSFILPNGIFVERYDNHVMSFYVQHLGYIERYLSTILSEANKPPRLTSVTTNFFGTRNDELALMEPESTKDPINRQAHFENMQAVWRSRLKGLDLSSPHTLLQGLQQQLNKQRFRYGDSKAYLIKVLPNITEKTTWGEARTALESGGKIPTGLKEAVDYINYRSILGTVNESKDTPGDSSSPKKS